MGVCVFLFFFTTKHLSNTCLCAHLQLCVCVCLCLRMHACVCCVWSKAETRAEKRWPRKGPKGLKRQYTQSTLRGPKLVKFKDQDHWQTACKTNTDWKGALCSDCRPFIHCSSPLSVCVLSFIHWSCPSCSERLSVFFFSQVYRYYVITWWIHFSTLLVISDSFWLPICDKKPASFNLCSV